MAAEPSGRAGVSVCYRPDMDILVTERLRLRTFHAPDAPFLLGLINEPAWVAGIRDSGVRTEAAALEWMHTRLIEPNWQHGHGFWMVERRSDGEPLGMCGIFKRETLPLPDLGYGFATRHTGHGYAREAAAACLDYAVSVLGRYRLMAIASPNNTRSAALLRALGFVPDALHTDDPDGPTQDWCWRSSQDEPQGDTALLDDLMRRFFAAFTNAGGRVPTLAALPAMFLPEARIRAPGAEPVSVRDFVVPRAELLASGRLREFSEWELEAHTDLQGEAVATRHCRYAKRGILDGQPFGATGRKDFRLARDAEGRWRIAGLAWEDD